MMTRHLQLTRGIAVGDVTRFLHFEATVHAIHDHDHLTVEYADHDHAHHHLPEHGTQVEFIRHDKRVATAQIHSVRTDGARRLHIQLDAGKEANDAGRVIAASDAEN